MLNTVKSDILDEKPYGVPQGSVLSPLLFLIHINGITDTTSCKSNPYADDTVMIIAEKSDEKLESRLNIELSKAETWLSNNKLKLNIRDNIYAFWKQEKN